MTEHVVAKSIEILGVRVDVVTMDEALAAMREFVRQGGPHLIVTADAAGIAAAQDDCEHREIINTADLVTPDGIGVLWAAKRKGTMIPSRVSGVDIVDRLCENGAKESERFYFLGAAPGVAKAAAENLAKKHPGMQIAGTRDGYFTREQEPEVVKEIAEARPHYLFAALGIPKQEKFLSRNREALGVPVMIGVGGTLDVYSGLVKRAPAIFQKLNLEWLWRLLSNPKKITKVAMLPRFVKLVLTKDKKGMSNEV